MGELFKNLKSLFVIESKSGDAAEAPDISEKTPESAASANPDVEEKPSLVNKKFTEILFKAIEDNNQDGYDYLEFKQSLQNLKALHMDEATRFKSAFASAKPLGATRDGLLHSAQQYQEVLNSEEKKFAEALANQKSIKIDSRHADMEKLEQTIKDKNHHIEELHSAIQKLKQQLSETKAEISDAEIKFQETQQQFVASYHNLIQQIKTDVDKIKQYLT